MIVDINTFLGHYPFRQVRSTTPPELIAQMDANGIEIAMVQPLHAVFYRDVQRGNEEMLETIADSRGRLQPVGIVNPAYAGWERDLRWLAEVGQVRAIALFPEHHAYPLTDDRAQAAIRQIAGQSLPLVLTQRLEDRRQRHHWDVAEDLKLDDMAAVARAHPTLRVALANWSGLAAGKLLSAGLRGRCLIDFARLHVLLHKDVPKLIEALGPESIAFGSHLPFDYPAASLVKLSNIRELIPDSFERIAGKNAKEFFGIAQEPLSGGLRK